MTSPDTERNRWAALYVLCAGALVLLLTAANPKTTWPGYLVVLSGIPVYFLWRRRSVRAAGSPS